jgi:hypothetical protein
MKETVMQILYRMHSITMLRMEAILNNFNQLICNRA